MSNLQDQPTNGLFTGNFNAQITIEGCTLLNNQGFQYTFCCLSGSITVTNCTIDKETHNTGVSVDSLPAEQSSFINAIKCTEADICDAEYDEYGTLKPNLPDEGGKGGDGQNHYTVIGCEKALESGVHIWPALKYIALVCFLPVDPSDDIWYDIL